MSNNRLQHQVTTGRFTLPVSIMLAAICWLPGGFLTPGGAALPESPGLWQAFGPTDSAGGISQMLAFLLYLLTGYLLIAVNSSFALIRVRASVQTSVFLMLVAVCTHIHLLYEGSITVLFFVSALYFLFRSYQQPQPSADVFLAFVFVGLCSMFYPQLTWVLVPVFWMGTGLFQSLNAKSFCASLLGWVFPWCFLAGHAYFYEDLELLYHPFREMIRFQPIGFEFLPWKTATMGYMFVLFAIASIHCIAYRYDDKIRTRNYLHFLVLLTASLFLYASLQPTSVIYLLPLVMIGSSILAGHLFVLADNLFTNILFIATLVGLFILLIINLWTLS